MYPNWEIEDNMEHGTFQNINFQNFLTHDEIIVVKVVVKLSPSVTLQNVNFQNFLEHDEVIIVKIVVKLSPTLHNVNFQNFLQPW